MKAEEAKNKTINEGIGKSSRAPQQSPSDKQKPPPRSKIFEAALEAVETMEEPILH